MKNYRHFEDVLKQVGSLGPYQWFVYFLMQYSNLLETANQNFMAFGKIEPTWICDDDDRSIRNYTTNPRRLSWCPNKTICRLSENRSEFFYSLVEHWSLYCDLSYVPMFIISIQMLGMIPGAFLFNHLIDNYGRKSSCHSLIAAVLISGLSCAFVDEFGGGWRIFAAMRFFIGFLFGGLFTVGVVTQMEILEESHRMWMYALDTWCVWNGVLALLAYLTGDWKRLIIVSNCLCIPLLVLMFWIKESPRWLVQKGRIEEAASVLNDIAKWNRRKVRVEAEDLIGLVHYNSSQAKSNKRTYSFLDIFHSKKSTINFATISFGWLATACISYGLVYQSTAYTGSPYVNYAVAAAFRVLTQVIVFVSDKYLKCRRRVMYLVSLGLVVSMLTIMTVVVISADLDSDRAAATVLRLVGLVCSGAMSTIWLIVYLLPIEIFPTVIRNIAMGGCSVMGRVGAVLGPQLLYLQKFWSPTPFVGFMIIAVINFAAVFFTLPETRGASLPDALDDDDNLEMSPDRKPDETEMLEKKKPDASVGTNKET